MPPKRRNRAKKVRRIDATGGIFLFSKKLHTGLNSKAKMMAKTMGFKRLCAQ
jgi:hypothetical protein